MSVTVKNSASSFENEALIANQSPIVPWTPTQKALIGAGLGALEPVVGQVFDYLKRRSQLDTSSRSVQEQFSIKKVIKMVSCPQLFKNTIGTVYAGFWLNSGYMGIATMLQFGYKQQAQKMLTDGNLRSPTKLEEAISSLFSGFMAAVTFAVPAEMIMTRFAEKMRISKRMEAVDSATPMPTYGGIVKEIYQKEGITGFWKGWKSLAARDMIYVFMGLSCSKTLDGYVQPYIPHPALSIPASAAATAAVAGVASHLFDTRKVRVQMGLEAGLQYLMKHGMNGVAWRTARIMGAIVLIRSGEASVDALAESFSKMGISKKSS